MTPVEDRVRDALTKAFELGDMYRDHRRDGWHAAAAAIAAEFRILVDETLAALVRDYGGRK